MSTIYDLLPSKEVIGEFCLPPKAGPKAKDQTNGSSGKSNVDLATNDVTNFTIMTVTGTLSKMADAKADIHNIIKIDIAKRFRLSTHNIMDSVSWPIQSKRPNRSTHSIITNIAAKNNKVVHSILCINSSRSSRFKIISKAIIPNNATHPIGRVLNRGTDCMKKQTMTNTSAPLAWISSVLFFIGY
uniref:Uncharacterized protein n=1 Tax=Glossina palpalis gambiensis TaxID=67801 RepID=A0A1B0AT66_9MUSC